MTEEQKLKALEQVRNLLNLIDNDTAQGVFVMYSLPNGQWHFATLGFAGSAEAAGLLGAAQASLWQQMLHGFPANTLKN